MRRGQRHTPESIALMREHRKGKGPGGPPLWTRASCVAAVQAFHERHGYQPVSSEANAHNGLPTWQTVKRLFGSWNEMIEAAGFTPYPARSSVHAKRRAFLDRNPKRA